MKLQGNLWTMSANKKNNKMKASFPSHLPKLRDLLEDLFQGGKGFRSELIHSVGETLGLSSKILSVLSQTIEFIHNASLLHDDLVDRSYLRRGKPSAWVKYSPEYAVLAGDYLLASAMVDLSHLGSLDLVKYTAEVMSKLIEGEWIQDTLKGNFSVQLDEVDRIHDLKTASLFKWCLRAPFFIFHPSPLPLPSSLPSLSLLSSLDSPILSSFPQTSQTLKIPPDPQNSQTLILLHSILDEMGFFLGRLFQRSDDLLDFDVRNHEGKIVLSDLKSGYLNSFGAFASARSDLNEDLRRRLPLCQTVEDFKILLGGEYHFNIRVQEFDQENQKWIESYVGLTKKLATLFGVHFPTFQPAFEDLTNQLAKLPEILYWRG